VEHNQNATGLGLPAPGDGWMVLGEVGYDTGLVPGELRTLITQNNFPNHSSEFCQARPRLPYITPRSDQLSLFVSLRNLLGIK
jgi:hypothetical protein